MKRADRIALHLNNYRVIPRLVILWLLHTTWMVARWVMHLQRPISGEDVAFVALFTGLFVVAFKFYVDAGEFHPTSGAAPK